MPETGDHLRFWRCFRTRTTPGVKTENNGEKEKEKVQWCLLCCFPARVDPPQQGSRTMLWATTGVQHCEERLQPKRGGYVFRRPFVAEQHGGQKIHPPVTTT